MARIIIGTVANKKSDKTIVVSVHVRQTHPLYRKQYTVTKRFMAHDENNEAQEGDKVAIVESRPLSKHKHFKLDRVIEKAAVSHTEQTEETVAEVTGQKAKEKTEEAAE
jgi:small subunit ribosomal protein S17